MIYITGYVVSFWRMWRGKAQILKRCSAQEHVIYTAFSGGVLWKISFTKYIWVCPYKIYLSVVCIVFSLMFRVSPLINQINANIFCITRKYLLFCKKLKLTSANLHTEAPINKCLNVALYLPVVPTLILYWYQFGLRQSTCMKLGCLCIAFCEMWSFCSILNAIQWYKLNTYNNNTVI